MSDFAREPFEWVEIDQDFCTRSYGVAPCTASLTIGGTECYNTRSTCQDPTNYVKGTRTLRFCKNQAFLPNDGNYYIPTLVSASISAGSINPAGANSSSTALGTRGGVTVTFQDGPHTDRYVDPYIADRMSRDAGYIATERGTFWSKWRARNQYYLGRVIRYKTGFIENGAVVDVTTRTYFLTAFEGPDGSGQVRMAGKDILSKIANEKAKVPAASEGKLRIDLTTSANHAHLDPAGIISEYPASGYIRIGKEILAYSKNGPSDPDRIDITRAQYGTSAVSAKAGDIVQLCKVYSAEAPADILDDLLTNFAGIPAGYLDTAQWAQEQTDYLPRLYSTVISEPTGVQEIIAEMCEQMYFYLIWDERAGLLKMRAIRPAQDDTVYSLSDFRNFLADSVSLRDLPDQLYTQIWVYYGLINFAESTKDEKNYAVREIIATDEGSANKQDLERIKKIYCRWIDSANAGAAVDLGQKMIARYGSAPRQVAFTLTGKDSAIWIGDFVTVNHRLSVDPTGAALPLNIQVMSAQETRAGTEYRYIGQEFVYEAPIDPDDRLIEIAADQVNFNLRTYHDSIFAPPVGNEIIRVRVRSGVAIGGRTAQDIEGYSGTQGPLPFIGGSVRTVNFMPWANQSATSRALRSYGATYDGAAMLSDMWEVPVSTGFDTGTWPSGVTLILTLDPGAFIIGEGGYIGVHTNGTRVFVSDGGHAMKIRHPISINNGGIIAGGGAGGFMFNAAWGGAGAGYANGIAIAQQNDPLNPADFGLTATVIRSAAIGSRFAPGTGSVIRYSSSPTTFFENTGLTGGALATNTRSTGDTTNRGGRGGYSIISGASMITWTNKGDVRGPEVA